MESTAVPWRRGSGARGISLVAEPLATGRGTLYPTPWQRGAEPYNLRPGDGAQNPGVCTAGGLALAEPADACGSLRNAGSMKGAVAVVERGSCPFVEKVRAQMSSAPSVKDISAGAKEFMTDETLSPE